MTPAEIKTAIESQFPGSVLENEDLAENQVELKGEQWLEMATFLKNDPNLCFDQLECITGIDTGEEGPLQTRYNLHSMEHRHKIEVVITILFIIQNFPLERIISHSINATKTKKLAVNPIIPSAILLPIF